MDLSTSSTCEIARGVQQQRWSAASCLERSLNQKAAAVALNAFIEDFDQAHAIAAREAARSVDVQLEQTGSAGRLAGVPIAIKDGICTRQTVTTAGSRMLKTFVSPYDATCVERLKREGAIVVGKTNMDEFAMGSSTENSYFGPTLNPHNVACVPGGSSGGSAAAVAAGIVSCALGSDTGGSIRQPASFCGITGLKPTYGRVSRRGLIAYASSLDQIGPMAATAQDCALLMNVIAGRDQRDSTARPVGLDGELDYLSSLDTSIAGKRIGVCRDFFGTGLDGEIAQAVEEALQVFKSLGATVVDIELPHAAYAVAAYYVIAPCEASSNLSRYDGVRFTYRHPSESLEELYSLSRGEGFGPEVQRRIMLGTFALSSGYYDAYYLKASKIRRLIKQDFDRAWTQVDVIAGPTTPTTAFRLGAHTQDPLAMYLADVYTVSANLAGIPAISIPCGLDSSSLPIGLQLQGPPLADATLLQFSHQYQQQTQWHRHRPKGPWQLQDQEGGSA